MISINEAKRLVKRALLANLATDKRDLAITPLVSGRHGIGKSQMVKSIAQDLGGVCITIEGGTLKEGEITGLPYQYTGEAKACADGHRMRQRSAARLSGENRKRH